MQEGTAIGSAVGTSAVSIALLAGAISGPVGAVIGAGIALVATLVNTLIKGGCGITCVETSEWANKAEPLLRQNVQAYFAQPAPRSHSSQAAALGNFDTVWQTLRQQCSQPGTGQAGVNCIGDRQAGACKWKQTSDSVLLSIPGEPQPGACWNWFSGYRDPIANDTDIAPDESSALAQGAADTSASVVSGSGGGSLLTIGLIAAAVFAVWTAVK